MLIYQLQINGETVGLDMFTLLLPAHFSTCNEHGLFSYPLFLCWLVCLWSLNCNSVVLLHGSLSSLESWVKGQRMTTVNPTEAGLWL